MKILIRKFDGIRKRDRAPHPFPAPDPNGARERRHPFSVSRLDSRHLMVERCAPSVLSWLKPRPAKRGDTSIAAVRRADTGLAAPRHLCSAQTAHTTPYPTRISVPRHAYRTVARIASGVDAVRARFGICAVVFVAAQAKRTQRQMQPLPPFATARRMGHAEMLGQRRKPRSAAAGITKTTLEQAGLALGFVHREMFVGQGGGHPAAGSAVEQAQLHE